jgi:hypothetical protein
MPESAQRRRPVIHLGTVLFHLGTLPLWNEDQAIDRMLRSVAVVSDGPT